MSEGRQPGAPSEERTAAFDLVQPMLLSAHKEMSELSKKKQDGAVNELKIRHINRLLMTAQSILGEDSSMEFLELLDAETVPQNSDAVLVLGQWLAAMEQFKEQHVGMRRDGHKFEWLTDEYWMRVEKEDAAEYEDEDGEYEADS